MRQFLDGSWGVYCQDRKIAQHPATELKEPIRALGRKKKPAKATVPYSWIYQASAPSLPP